MDYEILDGITVSDYTEELNKAEEIINDLKFKFKEYEIKQELTEEQFVKQYKEIIRVLYYVGKLSQSIFDIETKMETQYIRMYPHSPELASKLFDDHYHKLHKPFNLLKNRCFTLLESLDELFFEIHSYAPKEFVDEF